MRFTVSWWIETAHLLYNENIFLEKGQKNMGKNVQQRSISLLLACVMVLGLCPAALAVDGSAASDTQATGLENGTAALSLAQIGRYDSGMTNADGGVMEIVDYNSRTGYAYAVNGQAGVLTAISLNGLQYGRWFVQCGYQCERTCD
jgi:hypothetical protein